MNSFLEVTILSGKSHVAMGATTLVITMDTCVLLGNKISSLNPVLDTVKLFLMDNQNMPFVAFIILSAILFFLGCLLPDIDYPYSTLGKIIYIPIEHRTWTHAIWIPAALCVAGIKFRYLFWLGLGIFLHDFWVSFSSSGLDWFYPIQFKKRNHLKLYKVGEFTEYIIVAISICLSFALTFFALQSTYHFVNISFL